MLLFSFNIFPSVFVRSYCSYYVREKVFCFGFIVVLDQFGIIFLYLVL